MTESFELRVLEEYADRVFAPNEGEVLSSGLIRKVSINAHDPRLGEIRRLQSELNRAGRSFFHGWSIRRRYTRAELAGAELFVVSIDSVFEPAGEECGTRYDDARACDICGAGAPRMTPLFLKARRIPKRDIARTIADEWVVSRAVKKALESAEVKGVQFQPVYDAGSRKQISSHWELVVPGRVSMHTRTRVEDSLFSGRNLYACPRGDRAGASRTSELFVKSPLPASTDVMLTKEFLGFKRGLLRPAPLLLVRRAVRDLFDENKFTGFRFEIAHVVD